MSFGISINLAGTPFERLQRLTQISVARDLLPVMGVAGHRVMIDHFTAREQDPASHRTTSGAGGRSSNLFAQFARATTYSTTAASIVITVAHVAARQRYLGGTIRPSGRISQVTGRPIENLAIPARAEAVGKRPSEFDLEPAFGRNGVYGLMLAAQATKMRRSRKKATYGQMEAVAIKGQEKGLIMFWLVDEVTQAPDPKVLPDGDQLSDGIIKAAGDYIQAVDEGSRNG